MLHQIVNTLHSGNRYLLLAALVLVLFRSWSGWTGKKPFQKTDNTASVILLGLAHLQLLLGIVQFCFTSAYTRTAMADMGAAMKNEWLRYFTVEHSLMMVIAVVFIQIGRTTSKKALTDEAKHKKLAIWTTAAALIIVATLAMKGILFGSVESAG
ncbi:MAG: hypothetical protein ACKVUS_20880 [Saprospiraceae bacterium]